jgi:hypothetical protein
MWRYPIRRASFTTAVASDLAIFHVPKPSSGRTEPDARRVTGELIACVDSVQQQQRV